MNSKLSILFVLFIIQSYSQSFEDKMRLEVCNCLGKQFSINIEDFNCFEPLVLKYGEEIDEYLLKNENGKNQDFEEFLKDLLFQNQQYYFENCGNYYESMKYAYDEAIRQSLEAVKPDKIEKLNEYIKKYEYNSVFILERGILYLKENKNYLAKNDFERLIQEDSTNYRALALKAIILEKEKKYNDASIIYDNLYRDTGEIKFTIMSEFMKFKQKGK